MITTTVPTLDEADAARDLGMARVEKAAGEQWRGAALDVVRQYAKNHTVFLTEDVREFAQKQGMAPPPNEKAWGPVMLAAAREGVIVSCGTGRARSSNNSPKVLWKSRSDEEKQGLLV